MAESHTSISAELARLSGEALELALLEIRTMHENAVRANDRLRNEVQQVQSIAAIVVSLLITLSAPATTGMARLFTSVAIFLLMVAVFGSFLFLFSRSPSSSTGLTDFLASQTQPVTADMIRRYQLAHSLAISKAGSALIRRRTLFANLIKAALASSIALAGAGILVAGI